MLSTYQALIVSAALLISSSALGGPILGLTETFDTGTHQDVVTTTAFWDTDLGQAYLPGFPLALSTSTPVPTRGMALYGPYILALTVSQELSVFRVNASGNLAFVSTVGVGPSATSVAVQGRYAYVAVGTDGLVVVDLGDIDVPVRVGSWGPSGNATSVAVAGTYCYLGTATGLDVIDIFDPTNPQDVGSLGIPCADLQIDGDLGFCNDIQGRVYSLDLSDPEAPAVLDFVNSGSPQGLALHGDRLFVAMGAGGLRVMDVSDPTNLVVEGGLVLPDAVLDVDCAGNFVYAVGDQPQLHLIDASDPLAMEIIATGVVIGNAGCVLVDGDRCLVGDSGGLRLFGAMTPRNFTNDYGIAIHAMPGGAESIVVHGNYAYACGQDGVVIVDLIAPGGPHYVTTYDPGHDVSDLAFFGDYAVLVPGVTVADFGDPENPVAVASYPGDGREVVIQGDYAYVAGESAGLVVYDLSTPTAPSIADTWTSPSIDYGVVSLDVSGDHAVIVSHEDTGSRIWLMDVADPTGIGWLAYDDISGLGARVQIWGDFFFIGGDFGHVKSYALDRVANTINSLDTSTSLGPVNDFLIQDDSLWFCGPQIRQVCIDEPDDIDVCSSGPNVDSRAMATTGELLLFDDSTLGQLKYQTLFNRTTDYNSNRVRSIILPEVSDTVIAARGRATGTGRLDFKLYSDGHEGSPVWLSEEYRYLYYPSDAVSWEVVLRHEVEADPPPVCDEVTIEWLHSSAPILAVADTPGDQGGQVRLRWGQSGYDLEGSPTPVVEYAVFRRVDDKRTYPPGQWDYVTSVPAMGEAEYMTVVPTLADSSIADGMRWSTFFVRALTAQPTVFFDSQPDSGWSVDNLAPGVPEAIMVAYQSDSVILDWEDAPEIDFQYYRIYRGNDSGFTPSEDNLIHETATSAWTDPSSNPWGCHYKITALDYSGNESEAASPSEVTGVQNGTVPMRTALLGAVPNPFNPNTKLSFEMAAAGHVRLKVYDTAGRLVTTLVNERRDAGLHEVTWDGRDHAGQISSAGVYLYRLEVGDFIETKGMTLIK